MHRMLENLILSSLLMFMPCIIMAREPAQEILQQAYASYQEGETATTIAKRKAAFNFALALYTQLERTYHPVFGDGKLYFNIGNTYFQLEEFPLAAYYYYRAKALMPRDERVQTNLSIAQAKMGITSIENWPFLRVLLLFHTHLSLPERLQIFFVAGFLFLIVASVYIWRPQKWHKLAMKILGFICLVMLLSVGYTRYFAPIEAVLIRSTTLYRDAGEQYATVSTNPTLAGNKVTVLEVLKEGQWLKIISPTGEIGYVPNSTLRII
jgi:tetratricopeptide (TPR) repeat protein